MKVSLLNIRITIQKNITVFDEIGNNLTKWRDYYTCFATVSNESPLEQTSAGAVWDKSKIDFTIRYATEVKHLDSTKYRILFDGAIYNIQGIDRMHYKKKSIKLHCQRVER